MVKVIKYFSCGSQELLFLKVKGLNRQIIGSIHGSKQHQRVDGKSRGAHNQESTPCCAIAVIASIVFRHAWRCPSKKPLVQHSRVYIPDLRLFSFDVPYSKLLWHTHFEVAAPEVYSATNISANKGVFVMLMAVLFPVFFIDENRRISLLFATTRYLQVDGRRCARCPVDPWKGSGPHGP